MRINDLRPGMAVRVKDGLHYWFAPMGRKNTGLLVPMETIDGYNRCQLSLLSYDDSMTHRENHKEDIMAVLKLKE